jgi:heparanase 1
MHNTLASSDYGLLNEDTLEPRPDYWAAVLWKRTMSDVVLDPGVEIQVLR